MDKINITYIAPRFRPFKGGGEENLYHMASRMALEGHNVKVFTTAIKFRDEVLPYREEIDGIKVIRNWGANSQLYAGFYPSLLPMIIRDKTSVIHSSGIGFFWREFCLIIKKLVSRKTKFIVTPHGPFMALNDKKGIRGLAKKYGTIILRLYIGWLYDKFIAITPTQHEWMTKEYNIKKEKIVVLPNGISKDFIESETVEHKSDDKIVITFVGRMEWYKGIQNVIKALGNIKKDFGNFEFVVMGRAGKYAQTLKEIAFQNNLEKQVRFIFSPTDAERDKILYEESQITILPSKWEGTGISLIEGMGKGNAIISTNQNDALSMIIKPDLSGYSYDFANNLDLQKILLKLFTDYNLRQKIRAHNLEFAKTFTWESIFPKYMDLVSSLVV